MIEFNYVWDKGSLGAVPEVDGLADYVVVVNWRYRGTLLNEDPNQTISDDLYGQQTFQVNPEQSDYVPFDELTPEIVIGWLNLDEEAMQLAITKRIEAIVNPPIVYPPVPWENTTNA